MFFNTFGPFILDFFWFECLIILTDETWQGVQKLKARKITTVTITAFDSPLFIFSQPNLFDWCPTFPQL